MPRTRHYIAQPFWKRAYGVEPGVPVPFVCGVDAEEGGAILAREAVGVLVYQQLIDDEAAIYDEPEILAVFGEVPRGAMAIDGDGRDPWLDDVA